MGCKQFSDDADKSCVPSEIPKQVNLLRLLYGRDFATHDDDML